MSDKFIDNRIVVFMDFLTFLYDKDIATKINTKDIYSLNTP